VKIYFDVSTGCLHFEIDQEDTRRVSVVREKKKKTNMQIYILKLTVAYCRPNSNNLLIYYGSPALLRYNNRKFGQRLKLEMTATTGGGVKVLSLSSQLFCV